MPAQIPIYQSRVLPAVTGGARVPASLGQGLRANADLALNEARLAGQGAQGVMQAQGRLAQAFDAVTQVGNQVFNLGVHLADSAQSQQVAKNAAAALAEEQSLRDELAKAPDFATLEDRYKEGVAKISAKYSDGLYGQYATKFESNFAGHAASGLSAVRKVAFAKSVDAEDATTGQLREGLGGRWLQAPDQSTRLKVVAEYDEHLADRVARGTLAADKRQALVKNFRTRLALADVRRVAESEPARAKAMLDDPKQAALLDADPLALEQLRSHVGVRVRQWEAEQREVQTSAYIQGKLKGYGSNFAGALDSIVADIREGTVDAAMGKAAFGELNVFEAQQLQRRQLALLEQDRSQAQQYAKVVAGGDLLGAMRFARASAASGNPHAVAWMDAIQAKIAKGESEGSKLAYSLAWGEFSRVVRTRDARDQRIQGAGGDFRAIDSTMLLAPREQGGFGLDPGKLDDAYKLIDEADKQARKGGTNYMAQAVEFAKGLEKDKDKLALFTVTLQRQIEGLKDKAGRPLDDYSPEVFDVARNLLSTTGTGLGGGYRFQALDQERQEGKRGLLTDHKDWFDPSAPAVPADQTAGRAKAAEARRPDAAQSRAMVASWGAGFPALVSTHGLNDVAIARRLIEQQNANLPPGQKPYAMSANNVEQMIKNMGGRR